MSSASSPRELDIEAAIRRSIAAIPGAQLFKEPTSPDDLEKPPPTEDDDQALFRSYRETGIKDSDPPTHVDLINTWHLLETCESSVTSVSDSTHFQWQEPSIKLGKHGLPDHHVCQYCQHIVIRCNVSEEVERILVTRSREELDRAARGGCIVMEWMRWHLYGQLSNPPSDQSEIHLIFEPLDGCEEYLSTVRGEFVDWGPNRKGQRGKGEFGPFSVVTPYEDPASNHVRDRPVNLAVSSDKSFATAKEWIRHCHEWHPECRPYYKFDVPSRLLSVLDDSVKLVETARLTNEIRYAALSYCWGGEQKEQTNTANLRQRERVGLKVAELCGTLQDAVMVTRQLGLPYLWIDSLCIVQDDTDDKTKEVAKMGDIYSGAFVTISAASASSAQEGFLQDRSPSAIRRFIIPVQIQCEDEEMGWCYLYRPEIYDPQQEEPLNSRGWALQEYLLPPRLLIYGSWQMRWICRVFQESDGGPDHVYPRSFEKLRSKLESRRTVDDIRRDGILALDEGRMTKSYHCMQEMNDIIDLWPLLVEEFTSRGLSTPSDRSAAIYGVAIQYATLCSDKHYAAGLWASNIAKQLLWKRPRTYRSSTHNSDFPNIDDLSERVTRLPTWSWVSVDGKVTWPISLGHRKPQLEVVRCETANFGPLGAAGHVTLTVKGRMREAFLRNPSPNIIRFWSTKDFLDEQSEGTGEANASRHSREIEDPALTATAVLDCLDKHSG